MNAKHFKRLISSKSRLDHINPRICTVFTTIRKAKSASGRKNAEHFRDLWKCRNIFRGIFSSNSTNFYFFHSHQKKSYLYPSNFVFSSYHRVDCTCMAHDGYLIIIFSHLPLVWCSRNENPPSLPTMSLCLCLNLLFFYFPCNHFTEKSENFHITMLFCETLVGESNIKNAKGLSQCMLRGRELQKKENFLLMFSVCKYGIMRAKIS